MTPSSPDQGALFAPPHEGGFHADVINTAVLRFVSGRWTGASPEGPLKPRAARRWGWLRSLADSGGKKHAAEKVPFIAGLEKSGAGAVGTP